MLNHDLKAIENWAFQWKMSFNPDPTKQAEQVIFSSKSIKAVHPPIYFSNSAVVTVPHHKHIGLVLDESLTFAEHIKEAVIKARRGSGSCDSVANKMISESTIRYIKDTKRFKT